MERWGWWAATLSEWWNIHHNNIMKHILLLTYLILRQYKRGTVVSWFHSTSSSALRPYLKSTLPYLWYFYTNVCHSRPPFVWLTSSFGAWNGKSPLPVPIYVSIIFIPLIVTVKISVLCHKIWSSKKHCSVLQLFFPHYGNYFWKILGNIKSE